MVELGKPNCGISNSCGIIFSALKMAWLVCTEFNKMNTLLSQRSRNHNQPVRFRSPRTGMPKHRFYYVMWITSSGANQMMKTETNKTSSCHFYYKTVYYKSVYKVPFDNTGALDYIIYFMCMSSFQLSWMDIHEIIFNEAYSWLMQCQLQGQLQLVLRTPIIWHLLINIIDMEL